MTIEQTATDLVTLTIDGQEVSVPPGTLIIRAAEALGIEIPRFCDHTHLAPAGACRQCLVEITDAGNGRGFPKPQASCTIPVAQGMVVHTRSEQAKKAQAGIMEFLLINHPLDCPVCDKGGECPLQDQALSAGGVESRFATTGGVKRTYEKPIHVSEMVLLDRERCVLCRRCTRFAEEIPGDKGLVLLERGGLQQIGTAEDELWSSYFSGNVIQICPVGALTSADYRFRARPFDLVASPSVAEHDACGAAVVVEHRRGQVLRRLAGDDPEVNEVWISDKDRFGFHYQQQGRLTHPWIREDGALRPASWPEALEFAAAGLRAAEGVGVLTGGRLTLEDARAYAAFAHDTLGTDQIDFRARPHSAQELEFLKDHVQGSAPLTYADLDAAPAVVLAGLDPEDEAGTIFLRLRKSAGRKRVVAVAPLLSEGNAKLGAELVQVAPGEEAKALEKGLAKFKLPKGTVILAGERLALSKDALPAVVEAAKRLDGRFAWVPRRAGDRAAVEAGALPKKKGRDGGAIVRDAAAGGIGALVVGGVEVADLSFPDIARAALETAFVVSLEQRETEVTQRADVVFPVAAAIEKSGTYLTWEGRPRRFERILENPDVLTDAEVLAQLAACFDADAAAAGRARSLAQAKDAGKAPKADAKERDFAVASWKRLIGHSALISGDARLLATQRPAVVKVNAKAAKRLGSHAEVVGDRGRVVLPVEVADLPDGVCWLPANAWPGGLLSISGPRPTVDLKPAPAPGGAA